MSSLKKNIVFNYIGQLYVAFIGILVLPFYLRFMGAEAYGLIGFFTLLQSWMQLLDMGMTPALSREIANMRGTEGSGLQMKTLLRSLEVIFLGIAIVTGVSVFLARHWLAQEWLSIQELDIHLVSTCIGLMGVMLAIRCFFCLYRGGIEGYEQQVWLNQYNIVFNTLRYPGALLVIWLAAGNLLVFFVYQVSLSIAEVLVIKGKLNKQVAGVSGGSARLSIKEVRRILPFAAGAAYTSGIWVLVTQLDKLLLSKYLPLKEYGYFSLVAIVSAAILLLSGPVSKAILPRMTVLLSQGKEQDMLVLYRLATRFIVCIVAPVSLVMSLFSYEIVYIWTGDPEAAKWMQPVLPLFALGNGLLAIGAFQYYLQYAHGKLKIHVLYNTVSAVISIPLIVYAAINYGAIGVGYIWLGLRTVSLLLWTPYVHKVFAPGIHAKWMLKDVLPALFAATGGALLAFYMVQGGFSENRLLGLTLIVGAALLSFGCAALIAFGEKIKGFIRERV
nr:oligosaccharide flippase family protein [uncultured Pseudomonas sp.]